MNKKPSTKSPTKQTHSKQMAKPKITRTTKILLGVLTIALLSLSFVLVRIVQVQQSCMRTYQESLARNAALSEQLTAGESDDDADETSNAANDAQTNDSQTERNGEMRINIQVGDTTLTGTLYDNATARDLASRLPLTVDMKDLYDREMCYNFTDELEHDDIQTRSYEVGEIIYWNPGHSLVFMYRQNGERFAMQSVGRIDSGIELFENTGDTKVTIRLAE
ncbi:MAG: cyclophilin-like fold protein [Candidatus Saccharibacteria bacterium]|nr:cyclophilin-like fold protein [Candidatus Saccharibacteria bacterium]